MKTVMNLIRDDKGQDLAEYGIALAVIAAGAAAAALTLSGSVNTLWTNADAIVSGAAV